MPQVETVGELRSYRRLLLEREKNDKPCLVVSAGTCGQASGANDIIRIVKRRILETKARDRISVRITGCHGFCEMEPFILVEPRGVLYPKLKMADVPAIVDAVLDGEVIEDLLFEDSSSGRRYRTQDDIPFFAGQTRNILGSNQRLDPIRIVDYLRAGGYGALQRALEVSDRAWIVEEVKASGLRGRGGAGFPTGVKWELAAAARAPGDGEKYVVCNADEGDPGAYMDRAVLEGNPHAVIEGMILAGIAIGATRGIIYVRHEYPLAIKHATIAIRQAQELGVLGEDILGTGFAFDVEIVQGAGAFVCGEETALIKSIEGLMGEPRQRPPFPITRGIHGQPTCINNVETLANVPLVIGKGGQAYAEVGVPRNSGTKIFSLVGKVRNTGLVEVPLGTPISTVVHDIGGGAAGDAKIKAVQTGGPSGGCIPASMFDLPIDYDSLKEAGSIMGSGGMIVMDENTCMVDVARYFMAFLKDESCGKCFTCRKGTQRMYELLDDITKGLGTPEHLTLLEELALVVRDTTMCGLGQSASNPVLSTLKYFRQEYERHIVQKRCDAYVCKDLVGAPCARACPAGTEAWRYVAHIERGELEEAYKVIRDANPFPSICARVCNHPCETHCRAGASGGDPVSIRALKRYVTDNVEPSTYEPRFLAEVQGDDKRVAVIGGGPTGLTAAHYLSLQGFKVSLFEAGEVTGGMLFSAIPEYRLPRDVLRKELDALLNDRITVECGKTLGKDMTVDDLFAQGFKAVYVAIGALKSRTMKIEGEDADGVIPSMEYLRAFNVDGVNLAHGRVGVVGGGNSAIDAARIARRQPDVEGVTVLYRRTRDEMPAFEEEIEAALQEGVELQTLLTPVSAVTNPRGLAGIQVVANQLGDVDASGRRRPIPVDGSERIIPLDTLIVAISEEPETACLACAETVVELSQWGGVATDPDSLQTSRPGVFAGGDAVTGPNTVIDAIADGKKAAQVIGRYLLDQELKVPAEVTLPGVLVPPSEGGGELGTGSRVEPLRAAAEFRRRCFAEVETSLSASEALIESRRCLRCDLEFTRPDEEQEAEAEVTGR